jgi:hypothetical protein
LKSLGDEPRSGGVEAESSNSDQGIEPQLANLITFTDEMVIQLPSRFSDPFVGAVRKTIPVLM